MKTINLILIVAFLAFAATGFSTNDVEPKNNPLAVTLSLEKAMQNPRLVILMHQQLDADLLAGPNLPRVVTAKVKTRLAVYVIVGTYNEWIIFFSKRPVAGKAM